MKTRMLGGSVSITVASITGSRRSFVTPAQKSSAYNFLGNVVASTPREKKVCRSHGAFHAHCRRNTRAPALFSSSTCEPTTLLQIPGVDVRAKVLLEQNGMSNLRDLQTAYIHRFDSNKERLSRYLQEEVGISQYADDMVTLCIEGNISSGKSTFLTEVFISPSNRRKVASVSVALEPVDKWQFVVNFNKQSSGRVSHNMLSEFYNNPSRYAYTFQHFVFMTRLLQAKEPRTNDLSMRIVERSVFSDKMIFVEAAHEGGWMSDLELSIFESWFSPTVKAFPELVPDGFIYLRTSPETCMQRMQGRARGEETGVSLHYLKTLHEKHETWLHPRKSGSKQSSPSFVDALGASIIYIRDARVPAIENTPVLVLDFDSDSDTRYSELEKDRLWSIVETFASEVREQKQSQSRQ